ncbi:BRX domain-containing protein, partial [Haematococcus lacustris]
VDGVLLGLVVEEVAVGMHHVVVVASRLGLHGRQQQEEVRRSRLLAWGKGGAGQLGLDQLKDYNQPQAITAIDGRRVLHIACGGSHTFA